MHSKSKLKKLKPIKRSRKRSGTSFGNMHGSLVTATTMDIRLQQRIRVKMARENGKRLALLKNILDSGIFQLTDMEMGGRRKKVLDATTIMAS